ncbi:HlyD family efflux transporter periplasmic adaptor subunit [Rhodobacterales bacterium HKCCE2091]|nr:HlyD family efflux transporter periplasmic adaptor subunit [Rhodobacterales bacterium HKCCE2091]
MTSVRSVLIALVALAIAAALVVVTFRTEPEPVDLHTVARGPMEVTIHADGVTRVREVYEVSSPVAGLAQRALVRVGDHVTADETVVAVVEPGAVPILDARSRAQAEAALAEAEAAVRLATSELHAAQEVERFTRLQHDRTAALVERGLVSDTALESEALRLVAAVAALDAAVSRREISLGARDRAEAALAVPEEENGAAIEVRAPVTGVVLAIDALSERTVQAGTRLLSIGDPADLEIVADLLSSNAVRLPEAAEARVERWGGDTALGATLRRVDPVARTDVSALGIEEQRVDAVFDLSSPPETYRGLGQSYGVRLDIILWQGEDVIILPLAAAFREGGSWATFVEEDGIARLRRIELGQIGDDSAEVLGGLEPGDRVVLHPSNSLEDGTAITLRGGD